MNPQDMTVKNAVKSIVWTSVVTVASTLIIGEAIALAYKWHDEHSNKDALDDALADVEGILGPDYMDFR